MIAEIDVGFVDIRNRLASHNLNPKLVQLPHRRAGELLGKSRKDSGPGLDENDPGAPGIDGTKVRGQNVLGYLGECTCQLNSGWASPNHNKVDAFSRMVQASTALGNFKRQQHTAANLGGVFDDFSPGA